MSEQQPQMFMVIESERDRMGRASFTLFWANPDGVDDPGPQQIPRRRAQCFRAVPEEHIARGAILVDSEEEARARAWGDSDTPTVARTPHKRRETRRGRGKSRG